MSLSIDCRRSSVVTQESDSPCITSLAISTRSGHHYLVDIIPILDSCLHIVCRDIMLQVWSDIVIHLQVKGSRQRSTSRSGAGSDHLFNQQITSGDSNCCCTSTCGCQRRGIYFQCRQITQIGVKSDDILVFITILIVKDFHKTIIETIGINSGISIRERLGVTLI